MMNRIEIEQNAIVKLRDIELLFGLQGRKRIAETLSKAEDVHDSISRLQSELSLLSKQSEPLLRFLDVFSCPRPAVYKSLLESTKSALEVQLERLDQDGLLLMLEHVIGCMDVKDLKSICISIIKRLHVVPEKYLRLLANSGLLEDIPLNVRHQVWQCEPKTFERAVEPHCRLILRTKDAFSTGSSRLAAKQIVEYIGGSEVLFEHLCNYSLIMAQLEGDFIWCRVITAVVAAWPDSKAKIIGKLGDLALLIGAIHRAGAIDEKRLEEIWAIFCSLIITQAAEIKRELPALAPAPAPSTRKPESKSEDRKKRDRHEEALQSKPTKKIARQVEFQADSQLDDDLIVEHKFPEDFLCPYLRDAWRELSKRDADAYLALDYLRLYEMDEPSKSTSTSLYHILVRINNSGYSCVRNLDEDVNKVFQDYKTSKRTKAAKELAQTMGNHWKTIKESLIGRIRATLAESKSYSIIPISVREAVDDFKPHPEYLSNLILEACKEMIGYDPRLYFMYKVTDDVVKDYSKTISKPMYFEMILHKIECNSYKSLRQFCADVELICSNCVTYHEQMNWYRAAALRMREILRLEKHICEEKIIEDNNNFKAQLRTDPINYCSDVVAQDVAHSIGPIVPMEVSEQPKTTEMLSSQNIAYSDSKLSDFLSQWTLGAREKVDMCFRGKDKLRVVVTAVIDALNEWDIKGKFAATNTTQDYQRKVENVISLDLIMLKNDRSMYKSWEYLAADIDLMISNWLLFHPKTNSLQSVGVSFRIFWKKLEYEARSLLGLTVVDPHPTELDDEYDNQIFVESNHSLGGTDLVAVPPLCSAQVPGACVNSFVKEVETVPKATDGAIDDIVKPPITEVEGTQIVVAMDTAKRSADRSDSRIRAIHMSSQSAAEVLKINSSVDTEGVSKGSMGIRLVVLPDVIAEKKLRFGLGMMCDPLVHELLAKFLCIRVKELFQSAKMPQSARYQTSSASKVSVQALLADYGHKGINVRLPFEDNALMLCVQFLQLQWKLRIHSEFTLNDPYQFDGFCSHLLPADEIMVRHWLPVLMLEMHLSSGGSKPTSTAVLGHTVEFDAVPSYKQAMQDELISLIEKL